MDNKTKNVLKKIGYPIYVLYRKAVKYYGRKNPLGAADYRYYRTFGKHINWDNPKDINEKINWLKFHEDPYVWARLSDKYAVREFVKERGLEHILIPLYGQWNSLEEMLHDWGGLPEEFILKSNNGSGNTMIIKDELRHNPKKTLPVAKKWMKEKNYGENTLELHYKLIKNKILAEQLLKSDYDFSQSPIDYKIWCFNGKPFGCLVVYDRDLATDNDYLDFYDLDWNERTDLMKDKSKRHPVPKPKNWEEMIAVAKKLSKGFPEVRVDLYNIDGKIYFGEMTFTSLGGYMDYFSDALLQEMGENVSIDLDSPLNFFAINRKS